MVAVTLAESLEALLAEARSYLPPEAVERVEGAYAFAAQCHAHQKRASGEPFIIHPLRTALHLARLHLDADTLVAALLHDVVEDCGVPLEDLAQRFGETVARLVDGVTKLAVFDQVKGNTRTDESHKQAENIRKMLVAMARDLRVVLIKLADRLHNMETLDALSPDRQKAIAKETMDIYVPLAHRLGIWDIKWRLEDLAFRYLYPEDYRQTAQMVAARRAEREAFITWACDTLQKELLKYRIMARVYGRPKHLYSIWQKAHKYAAQGKDPSQIYDLYAVRIIVPTKSDCYRALEVVHNLWPPVPGQFDDYIGRPKPNGYQALHTAVIPPGSFPLEVQIRSEEMHEAAEYGVAAHVRYKEGNGGGPHFQRRMAWLHQLLEWGRSLQQAEEFVDTVKTDILSDQVFVFTPKGDVKELPKGSTPIDFAYLVHTELGHRCIGAKVNGKMVPLNYKLQTGDTVEILASKTARGPSLDWLDPDYTASAQARQKIRQWFRRQERPANIQRGKEVLERELKRLGMHGRLKEEDLKKLASEEFGIADVEDFYLALGTGAITAAALVARLSAQSLKPAPQTQLPLPSIGPASGIQVLGVGDLLVRMAPCCSPVPGDPIVGFVTRSRGVTIHRQNCSNLTHEDERERLLPVTWGQTQELYPVRVRITFIDRVGLLKDITTLIAEEGVNIASMVTREFGDGRGAMAMTLHIRDAEQLARLFGKIEGVRGVLTVSRVSNALGAGRARPRRGEEASP
ncbi:MAG: bifunctional (p)ppGpp synthetase/guanosine-3',5'-bis(diphosphate) 3'-pyrophosphohydrolase [Dehalococcoidia bacterium]|nr:bifunctional (p)ppGpp synthetase/guanosine-3',5'-bis(diphosphate) 3'-pyrophosphohydrolase [Dehalococcoidia bacterium]MDW8120038.1 bifunctional (p)ppGpp synthetase/guanosine-3',5'-bis(diphosphate) 3'-pyrophosphohydrolase [Chloroflexota bacterium]